MEVAVEPGKYVVAVSGGVDSVVLLDLLMKLPGLDITVAHFDHGIRADSADDAALVAVLAAKYGLKYITAKGDLGPDTSEATARTARYAFLRQVKTDVSAQAIITAHHQDDLLETAIFNMLRGTGRRGLTSLKSTHELLRPLLGESKVSIVTYATKRNLSWHEDSTNHDTRYTRNYIRHRLLVRFDDGARQQLYSIINQLSSVNNELDALLEQELATFSSGRQLERRWFTQLPHDVSKEVMATWLRTYGLGDFNRRTIDRLTIAAKVAGPGKKLDVLHGAVITVSASYLALELAER